MILASMIIFFYLFDGKNAEATNKIDELIHPPEIDFENGTCPFD
jgi:hypothetical protein